VAFAQCRSTQIKSTVAVNIQFDDKQWLAKQGWWCRVGRSIFGKCNPKSFGDLFSANLEFTSEVKHAKLAENVGDAQASQCVSEEISKPEYLGLMKCSQSQSLTDAACANSIRHTFQPFKNEGGVWKGHFEASASHAERAVSNPRVEVRVTVRGLTELAIGSIELSADEEKKRFVVDYSLRELLSLTSATPAFQTQDGVLVKTKYKVINPNGTSSSEAAEAKVQATSKTTVVNNLPETVRISRGDVLGFEDLAATDEISYQKGLSMASSCSRAIENHYLSEFGKFVCAPLSDLAALVSRHKQVRVKFKDQLGIERFVTWEHKPAARNCDVNYDGFTCQVPNESTKWEAWLYGNRDEEELVKRVIEDPSYDQSTQIAFDDIKSFLPRAEGATPLRTVVSAQSEKMHVVTQQ
jgi:hypothetical protein